MRKTTVVSGLILSFFVLAFSRPLEEVTAPTQIAIVTPSSNLENMKPIEGSCWTSSLANPGRPNAWRCQSNNMILDPCFENPADSKSVVCYKNPWTEDTAVLVKLTSALPEFKFKPLETSKSNPWALMLANGDRCTFMTGATGLVKGMRINYACMSGASILGDIDRSKPQWKAHYQGKDENKIEDVPVTQAWY